MISPYKPMVSPHAQKSDFEWWCVLLLQSNVPASKCRLKAVWMLLTSTSLDYIIPSWSEHFQDPLYFCLRKLSHGFLQELVKQMHDLTGAQIRQLVAKRAESRWRFEPNGGPHLVTNHLDCRIELSFFRRKLWDNQRYEEKTAAPYIITINSTCLYIYILITRYHYKI